MSMYGYIILNNLCSYDFKSLVPLLSPHTAAAAAPAPAPGVLAGCRSRLSAAELGACGRAADGGCGCGAAAAEVTLAGQEGTGTRCDPRQAQAQSRGFPGVRRDGGTLGPSQHGRWGGSLWGEVAAVSKANTTHARAAGLPAPTPAARPAPAGP